VGWQSRPRCVAPVETATGAIRLTVQVHAARSRDDAFFRLIAQLEETIAPLARL